MGGMTHGGNCAIFHTVRTWKDRIMHKRYEAGALRLNSKDVVKTTQKLLVGLMHVDEK